ncbi:hypothetical protein CL684_00530 [Candidatus Campbellbacteria bacterium]|mgnify:CR=1 FL=1|nr:hypothetical protein [Candidatus Campbellbacteria bacterium]
MNKDVIHYQEFQAIVDVLKKGYHYYGMTDELVSFLEKNIQAPLSGINVSNHNLPLPKADKKRTRNVVAKVPLGPYMFHVVVTVWNETSSGSPIHCHPKFTAYIALKGEAEVYPCTIVDGARGVAQSNSEPIKMCKGKTFFGIGTALAKGNFPHKIGKVSKGTILLHIYSANAELCDHYKEISHAKP